jgi:uncharacterized protein YbjT (DUF2867 family)
VRVVVVGGTGVVGRTVVGALLQAGHDAVVVARQHGVDVLTREGLDDALSGAEAVVDVTNVATLRRSRAERFFVTATTNLLAAEVRAGVQHHVVLSIVGVDRVGTGYYAAKRAQEETALAGPVPVSVLRSTQFHEFAEQMLARTTTGPVALVPRMRIRPVAAAEVGAALADLAVGPAVGRAPELAGPDVHDLPDLVGRVADLRGSRVRVLPVSVPGSAGRAMARGGLLPDAGAQVGSRTFDDWLAAQRPPGA